MKQSVSSGAMSLMASEGVFILSNYLLHIGIARYLGIEAYGIFGVLMSLYLLNRSFLNTGFPRAVSKFMAEKQSVSLIRTSLILQIIIALFFAFGYILFAPTIATWLHNPTLISDIRFLGIMVIPLALMALYTGGYMNGLSQYQEQAFVKFAFPVLRVVLAALFIILGMNIFGALLGMFIASVICLLFCFPLVKFSKQNTTESGTLFKLLSFAIPATIGALALTSLRNINVLFVQSILKDNLQTGLFTAALTLSNIPYLIITAFPLALLPAISSSYAAKDIERTKNYIIKSLRYLLLLLLPITALLSATATDVLHIFYGASYTSAGPVFVLLMISATFLALFVTLSTVIDGIGKPMLVMSITLFFIFLMILLNFYFIPLYGLMGVAFSSFITSFLAFCIVGSYVYYKFKVLLKMRSTINIVFASVIVFLLAYVLGFHSLYVFVTYFICGIVYLSCLFILREITPEDAQRARKVFKFH